MELIFFLISLCVSLSTAQASSSVVEQVETGFSLTPQVAKRVLSAFDFKSENREDFYVDIYDGKQFLLIPSKDKYKFRMKVTNGKAQLQVNVKKSFNAQICPENGLQFVIKEKEIGEKSLTNAERDCFSRSVVSQLDSLDSLDSMDSMDSNAYSSVVNDIQGFHKYILNLKVPLLEKLTSVPQVSLWYFVASHNSYKKKWKLKKDLGLGEIEISLSQAKDYVGNSFVQERYEIEFQEKDSMTINEFRDSVCKFLQELQMTPEDLNPSSLDPQAETLYRLFKFNSSLGF